MKHTYKIIVKKVSENYILGIYFVAAENFEEAEFLGWKKAKNDLHNTWTLNHDSHFFIYQID